MVGYMVINISLCFFGVREGFWDENFNARQICLAAHDGHRTCGERFAGSRQGYSEKAGLVRSSRGPLGGYRLVRAPEEYTAGEIVSSIEGGFAPVACMESETNECPRHQSCATLRLWEKLDEAIRSVMDSVTLADLVKWQKELESK